MSEKCNLGDDNSYIVTVYTLDYVRFNYFILFICLLCIETKLAWQCTLPFAHLYYYTNFKCKFEPLYIQHHHYLSLKKLYVSILRRITFITICTYRTSELRKNILEIQNY